MKGKNIRIFIEIVNTNEKYAKESGKARGIIKEDDQKHRNIQKGDCPYVGSK